MPERERGSSLRSEPHGRRIRRVRPGYYPRVCARELHPIFSALPMTKRLRRARLAAAFAVACCSLVSITAQQPSGPAGTYKLGAAYANEVAHAVAQFTGREIVALDCPPADSLTFNQKFECRGAFAGGGVLNLEMETRGVDQVNVIRINGEIPSEFVEGGPLFGKSVGIVAAIASLLAAILAAFSLRAFLKLYRGQYVTEPLVPLPSQQVSFLSQGSYVLYLRGPRRLVREFPTKSIHVWDPTEGAWLRSWSLALLNFRSSGFTTVQLALHGFQVPRPGVYTLTVEGLHQDRQYEDRLIFGRANLVHVFALLGATIIGFLSAMIGVVIALTTLAG